MKNQTNIKYAPIFSVFVFCLLFISACAMIKLELVYKPVSDLSHKSTGKSVYVRSFTDSRPAEQKNKINSVNAPGFESKWFNDENMTPQVREYVRRSIISELYYGNIFEIAKNMESTPDYILDANIKSFKSAYTLSFLHWGVVASLGCSAFFLSTSGSRSPYFLATMGGAFGIMFFEPHEIMAEITVEYVLKNAKTSEVVLKREFNKTVKKVFFMFNFMFGVDTISEHANAYNEALREINKEFIEALSKKYEKI